MKKEALHLPTGDAELRDATPDDLRAIEDEHAVGTVEFAEAFLLRLTVAGAEHVRAWFAGASELEKLDTLRLVDGLVENLHRLDAALDELVRASAWTGKQRGS